MSFHSGSSQTIQEAIECVDCFLGVLTSPLLLDCLWQDCYMGISSTDMKGLLLWQGWTDRISAPSCEIIARHHHTAMGKPTTGLSCHGRGPEFCHRRRRRREKTDWHKVSDVFILWSGCVTAALHQSSKAALGLLSGPIVPSFYPHPIGAC